MMSFHFWTGTLGILFYAVPMYWAGFTQGLMLKEFTPEGLLKYPGFLATTLQIIPMHALRAIGGTLYLAGVIVMTYNLYKTIKGGNLLAEEPAEALKLTVDFKPHASDNTIHRVLERRPIQFMVLALIAILIGGMVEMMPTFMISSNIPTITSVKPYSPLELQGRDIYIREGCVNCHTQTIRPFRSETERYGEYSKAGEYVYDHPFLWGSKRTGPDLHRVGAKYSNAWHFNHMMDPTTMTPGSIMPPYPWLIDQKLDTTTTASKIMAMQTLGVPYTVGYAQSANKELAGQAEMISQNLSKDNIKVKSDREIIAIIAYLQRLGTDIKVNKTANK
jgi:cytochrome c oxidase cbb3-type subunit I/II